MPRRTAYPKPLTLAFVRSVTVPGRYYDDDGLILTVSPTGSKRWLQRVTIAGRRSDLALGSAHVITPAQARKAAARQKDFIRKGGDPRSGTIAPRRSQIVRSPMRFSRFLTNRYAEIYEDSTPEKAKTNYGSLRHHTSDTIGKKPLRDIETTEVEAVLLRAAHESPERARWLRQNLIRVFDAAIDEGHIAVNPARAIKAASIAPPPDEARSLTRSEDLLERLPQVYATMLEQSHLSATMLMIRFSLLTARQSAECRLAFWREIDDDRRVWTIPASEDGEKPEVRVPLQDEMREVLGSAERLIGARKDGYVFASPQGMGSPITVNASSVLLRRRGIDLQVREIAIAFRTWTAATGSDDLRPWVAYLTGSSPEPE